MSEGNENSIKRKRTEYYNLENKSNIMCKREGRRELKRERRIEGEKKRADVQGKEIKKEGGEEGGKKG